MTSAELLAWIQQVQRGQTPSIVSNDFVLLTDRVAVGCAMIAYSILRLAEAVENATKDSE